MFLNVTAYTIRTVYKNIMIGFLPSFQTVRKKYYIYILGHSSRCFCKKKIWRKKRSFKRCFSEANELLHSCIMKHLYGFGRQSLGQTFFIFLQKKLGKNNPFLPTKNSARQGFFNPFSSSFLPLIK